MAIQPTGNLPNVTFANCWAHVRRYWLKADSETGKLAWIIVITKYTLNCVDGLKAFLFDGRMEMDNNLAENAIHPTMIGQKNWFFC